MPKKAFRIGIEVTGSELLEIPEREAVYGFGDEEDTLQSVLQYVRQNMTEEEVVDALNLDDARVVIVDELDTEKVILE
jgi:hypothetical protein